MQEKKKIRIKIKKEVFNDVYLDFLFDDTPLQIFYGGASSGKSVFLAQRLVIDLLYGDRNYLVCRKVGSTNRKSTFAEILKVIDGWDLLSFFSVNKSFPSITSFNGASVIFVGLDDVEKVKSTTPQKGVLTDIWVEEATEISRSDYLQLKKRLRGPSHVKKRITFSFNPILKTHWIYKEFFVDVPENRKVFRDRNRLIVHTTYRDNKFLTKQDIEALDSETDTYFRYVYTEGKWGVIGDVIFKNWEIVDNIKEKRFEHVRFGLDFGYSNHPTAFVKVLYSPSKKEIAIVDEVYQTGLSNREIAEVIKPIVGNEIVVCDSAEPKSIDELVRYGIRAIGADKGPDSVLFGIQWLQGFKILISPKCKNTITEFQLYQWQKKKDGEIINRPVDKYNHAIDALRYALCFDMLSSSEPKVVGVGKRFY